MTAPGAYMTRKTDREPPRVLYVDDDPKALELFREQTARHFDVTTAESGVAGLEALDQGGPYAVVVSDLKMDGMTGIGFLSRVRQKAPESVRLMVTGQADLWSAIQAVNEGHIFRFMNKPVPRELLLKSLEGAVDQYELVVARRILLEQTLRGSVQALTEVLAMASPAAFGRAMRAKQHVSMLADHVGLSERWAPEVAAMLSQLGCVALPPDTAIRLYQGEHLSPPEAAMVGRLPQLAEQVITGVPQLEPVGRILRYQYKQYDGGGRPDDSLQGEAIPWGARALKIALDFDALETQGLNRADALDTMRNRTGWYDPELLQAFAELDPGQEERPQELAIADVKPGMVFVDDVRTTAGALLIARGQEMTPGLSERIQNLGAAAAVPGTVRVRSGRG